jgi:hypothetical protein
MSCADQWFTPEIAAGELRRSVSHVYRLVENRSLSTRRVGRQIEVLASDVRKLRDDGDDGSASVVESR